MEIIKFNHATNYYQKVKNYLVRHEATHCLLLGIAQTLSSSAENNDFDLPYLAVVEDNQNILVTAIRTPPRKLILSRAIAAEAVEAIARDLATAPQLLPGIIAPQSEAQTFVNTWQDLTGQTCRLDVAMRVHQLETVQPITSAAGKLRLAVESDRDLLTDWGWAFEQEALGDKEPKSNHQLWFDRHLENKSLFVWQDRVGEVVSMAASGGATPNGIRINAVYTPPEYRGKGYATSCVAEISRQLRHRYRYCFLFTNLANPASNHIYQKIGFVPMCDINNYGFTNHR